MCTSEREFHRVFDGQNMTRAVGVAIIDHRRHGGGFARSGGADDQDQPQLFHDDLFQHRRQIQGIERRDVRFDETHHDADGIALLKYIDTKIPDGARGTAFAAPCEIHFTAFFELLGLLRRHQLVGDGAYLFRRHALIVDRHQRAVDLDLYRRAAGKEHIRRLLVGHQLE
jgi:hypothetical protein